MGSAGGKAGGAAVGDGSQAVSAHVRLVELTKLQQAGLITDDELATLRSKIQSTASPTETAALLQERAEVAAPRVRDRSSRAELSPRADRTHKSDRVHADRVHERSNRTARMWRKGPNKNAVEGL